MSVRPAEVTPGHANELRLWLPARESRRPPGGDPADGQRVSATIPGTADRRPGGLRRLGAADRNHQVEGKDAMTDEVRQDETTLGAEPGTSGSEAAAPEPQLTILLYASDRTVRENVRFTLGRKIAADLPTIRVLEVATQPAVLTAMDRGGIDLAILDGEAVPGGIGLCRQLKDEVFPCPPIMVLTGRRDDAWLATWSRADGVVPHPVDPLRLPDAVAALLRPDSDTRPNADQPGAGNDVVTVVRP
jgi:hypothetical protein